MLLQTAGRVSDGPVSIGKSICDAVLTPSLFCKYAIVQEISLVAIVIFILRGSDIDIDSKLYYMYF